MHFFMMRLTRNCTWEVLVNNYMEYLDIYDENRKWLGYSRPRGASYMPGEYHLIVHVCLMNERGEMLIQQRSDSVAKWPGMWDLTIGGHVLAGETPEQAAERKVQEELGLQIILSEAGTVEMTIQNRLDTIFVVPVKCVREYDGDAEHLLKKIVPQEEEVKAVRWASIEEIRSMIVAGRFLGYPMDIIEKICLLM